MSAVRLRSRPSRGERTPRVVVVSPGPPAKGGMPSFATMLVDDPVLRERYALELLNTTRRTEQPGGTLTFEHARFAVADTVQLYRRARTAEIVHIQTTLMPVGPCGRALAMAAAARLAGSRVLVHVHSARVNTGRADVWTPTRFERQLLRLLRIAHEVLTVSDAGARVLRPFVPGTPVARFDNAVDATTFAPVDDADGRADRRPVILYVGTLSRRKGLHDLVRALDRLRNQGIDEWRLEVIGGADEVGQGEADELRAVLHGAGLADALLGSRDRDEIARHLAGASVFVLPSSSEGQPIAVLEAMASGVPVVGTLVGAMPDVVRDGVDGFLVEPHDVDGLAEALAKLLCDEQLRRDMGASARRRVHEGYDLTSFRRRVQELYESNLAASGR